MVAYNFKPRFADAVERGEKRQTIRREGKRVHAKPGDKVQLYTGMRTKNCRKLGEAVCTYSGYVGLRETGLTLGSLPHITADQFARLDGFAHFDDMLDWFRDTHGLPFIGRLIQWTPLI